MTSDKVLIGEIISAHGIKGDVKIKSFTTNPSDLGKYSPLLNKDDTELKIKVRSINSDVLIAHIENIDDRTTAEGLKKTKLYTPHSSIVDEGKSEILLSDLIGFTVLDNKQNPIGKVVNISNFGAGDILEIKLPDTEKTAMLSYNKYSILEQNPQKGFIKIDTEHLLAN